uniref:alanyl-tRNA editing protein n=1 Tax=Agathobacter sp. TaxID=2021311 RepID=UPI0040576468
MATIKLYDKDAYRTTFEAVILSCTECSKEQESAQQRYEVILDRTCFFPEEGGQTPDKGVLGEAEVLDVQIKRDNTIIHTVNMPLEEGKKVIGKLDWQHRFFNMQQHSGEHLFSGLAYQYFGYQNVGFHLSNQIVTMDFNGVLTPGEVEDLEWKVNEAVAANVEIKTGYPSKEELAEMEYRSKKELDGAIRIVEISGYDLCACCAPHVRRTGEIGMFKVQTVQNYKGGVRISFLCGFRALEEYRKKSKIISELSAILTTNQEMLGENVSKLKARNQSLKMQLGNAKQLLMEIKINGLPAEQKDVLLFETDLETPVMRNVVNKLTERHEGFCGIFIGNDKEGYHFIIGSKAMDCREAAKLLKEKLNARGGGSAAMVQGSVAAKREAIEQVWMG